MDTLYVKKIYCKRTLIQNTVMASKCKELWSEITKQVLLRYMNETFDTRKTRKGDCEELIKIFQVFSKAWSDGMKV